MNDATWETCKDPWPMLQVVRRTAGGRKLRLFAIACSRRLWHLLDDPRSRRAVEVAERVADGLAPTAESGEARRASRAADTERGRLAGQELDRGWPSLATLTL